MSEKIIFPVINLSKTGRNLKDHRCRMGLSVKAVQKHFGFEYPQAIYKWEHGECLPSVDNLLALARLYRVMIEDLLICEDREIPAFLGTAAPRPESAALRVRAGAQAPRPPAPPHAKRGAASQRGGSPSLPAISRTRRASGRWYARA